MGIGDYIAELWNGWLWWAAGMLTAFELIQFFWKRTWGWPRAHPWRVAVAMLVLAQFGAYRSLALKTTLGASEAATKLQTVTDDRDALRIDRARLEGERGEKDRQITILRESADQLRDRLSDARDARPVAVNVPPLEVRIPAGIGASQPPEVEGLTWAIRKIPSPVAEAPHALEITLQAQATVAPFSIAVVADRPLSGGDLKIINRVIFHKAAGSLTGADAKQSFAALSETGISPTTPWLITVWGKESFKILRVIRPTS